MTAAHGPPCPHSTADSPLLKTTTTRERNNMWIKEIEREKGERDREREKKGERERGRECVYVCTALRDGGGGAECVEPFVEDDEILASVDFSHHLIKRHHQLKVHILPQVDNREWPIPWEVQQHDPIAPLRDSERGKGLCVCVCG